MTIPGTNTLLLGAAGTGKTYALGTMADSGIELFVMFVEESGVESLLRYWLDRGKKVPPNVHWHVLPRIEQSFEVLQKGAEDVSNYSLDALYKMSDSQRSKQNSFIKLLAAFRDFPDDRTGTKFGNVAQWDATRCIAVDSLTGLGNAAFSLVIGNKPVKSQTEWMVAQDQVERLVRQLCGCPCHFIQIAHVEREVDPVFGGTRITVATLGKALPPKIPRMFNDVILTQRVGSEFTWSTASAQADVKASNLPISEKITPDFGQIIRKWKEIGSILTEV